MLLFLHEMLDMIVSVLPTWMCWDSAENPNVSDDVIERSKERGKSGATEMFPYQTIKGIHVVALLEPAVLHFLFL